MSERRLATEPTTKRWRCLMPGCSHWRWHYSQAPDTDLQAHYMREHYQDFQRFEGTSR